MGLSFWLLVLAQGLYTVINVVLIGINALVGLHLAPEPRWATLPIALMALGSALATPLVARLQRSQGRQRGFQAGLLSGIAAFAICALAVEHSSFALFCFGATLVGFYGASGSLYRFAAAELVPVPLRERALSLVLVGGLIGAFLGPSLAEFSRDLLPLPFAGAYAALSVVSLLSLAGFGLIRFPAMVAPQGKAQGRSFAQLAKQPAFIVAILGAALGFGVMNFLMTATPIAMQQHHHAFHDSAQVLKWHVIAMFAPGLFSGRLIQRFGPLPIMAAGLILNVACVAVALSGVELMQFTSALIVLGLGWNFLYTGASALLLTTYLPQEKTRAQAAMDFCVFGVLTVSGLIIRHGLRRGSSVGRLVSSRRTDIVLRLARAWLWRRCCSVPSRMFVDGARSAIARATCRGISWMSAPSSSRKRATTFACSCGSNPLSAASLL